PHGGLAMRTLFGRGLFLALGVAALVPGRLRADERPAPDRKAQDQRLYRALAEVLNAGVALHNGDPQRGIRPNPEACYRLYQGGFLALHPMLDAYPELQKEIPLALARANQAAPAERGFVLRELLDKMVETVRPTRAAAGTLWERLGREANVRRVMED